MRSEDQPNNRNWASSIMSVREQQLLLLGILLLNVLLLCSFQRPNSTDKAWQLSQQFAHQQVIDSAIYYHQRWQNQLEVDSNQQVAANAALLTQLLAQAETEQYKKLTTALPLSRAWRQAFMIPYQLKVGASDSAYYYLNLLKGAGVKAKPALMYAYGIWAVHLVEQELNYETAINYLEQSKGLAETSADSLWLYPYQLKVYTAVGDFHAAAQAGKAWISRQKKAALIDSIRLAKTYQQLAQIFDEQANCKLAKTYYGEAINYLADRAGFPLLSAQSWEGLANCYFQLNNAPLETILYTRKVLSLLQELEDNQAAPMYLEAYYRMAAAFFDAKQLDSAALYLNKGLGFKHKTRLSKQQLWTLQGEWYSQNQEWRLAEQAYKKAITEAERWEGQEHWETATAWANLGTCYQAQSRLSAADEALDQAIEAASRVPSRELPDLHQLFRPIELIQMVNQKVAIMLALYDKSTYQVSLKEIQRYATYNVTLWEKLPLRMDMAQMALNRQVYEHAIEVCALSYQRYQRQEELLQAYHLAEAYKQTFLLQATSEPTQQGYGAVPASLLQQVQYVHQQSLWHQEKYLEALVRQQDNLKAWHQQQMTAQQAKRTLLEETLKDKFPDYYQLYYQLPKPNLSALQAALPDSTVVVQYMEGDQSIYQFIIRADTLGFRKIFWRTYKPTILKYYKHFTEPRLLQQLSSGAYQDFCRTGYELYHKLLHHEFLAGNKRLVIIPDGLLQYVPFGTLLTDIPLENVHEANFPSLAYVLRQRSLSYHYSSSLLLQTLNNKKEVVNAEVLAMAATYSNEQIAAFRSKKQRQNRRQADKHLDLIQEMDSLARYCAGDFYTNRYATEYYLKEYASTYGILHLALYGMADQQYPEYSSLIFAEDAYDEEDNFLMAHEIKQLNLNTAMVVLGNCASTYGGQLRGEGLTALGHSFLYAGSPSVVLSLWNEEQHYSPAVMTQFYQNLQKGEAKDVALRRAKLQYLSNTTGLAAHPIYWAAYVNMGNFEAIDVAAPVTYIWWFLIPIVCIGFLGWWALRPLRRQR